jgi:molecular chaperone GrpE
LSTEKQASENDDKAAEAPQVSENTASEDTASEDTASGGNADGSVAADAAEGSDDGACNGEAQEAAAVDGERGAKGSDGQPEGSAEQPEAAEQPEDSDEPDPTEVLQAELKKAQDRMLRVAADFENFKKRSRRELTDSVARAEEKLALEFLPIIDNLERAIEHGQKQGASEDEGSLLSGVKMVHKQFLAALSRYEMAPFVSIDEMFDPEFHEALQQAPSDKPRNTVIMELQKGYKRKDRLVRPAMVVVSQGPPPKADGETASAETDSEKTDSEKTGPADADETPEAEQANAAADGTEVAQAPASEGAKEPAAGEPQPETEQAEEK